MKTVLAPQNLQLPLFSRTQGSGDIVVCLHSSSGSHSQWRGLAGTLAERCQVITPDLHGHGRSPAWPNALANTLHVDAHGVSVLMGAANHDSAPQGVHLVGHSYGGAVALQLALCHPRRVRSLTLYEPVPFGMMRRTTPDDPVLGEIEDIAHSVGAMVRAGDLDGAARTFVGYWGGVTAWESMGPAQRASLLERISTVPRHFDALLRATWSARLLSRLTMPVLLLQGSNTRAPARRVAELLAEGLPQLRRFEFASAGHLGPMTHESVVNAAVVEHLRANGVRSDSASRAYAAFA